MWIRPFLENTALILAVFYGCTVMKPIVTVMDYTVHYGTYANELCENKDKPQLHCNGTCQLMQKLKAMGEAREETPVLPQFESLYWYIGILTEIGSFGLTDADRLAYPVSGSFSILQRSSAPPVPPPLFFGSLSV